MPSSARRDLALAAVSGLLLGAAFLPRVPSALALVAFVPLLLALERRVQGMPPAAWFRLGYAAGLVFFLVGTHWIALLSDVALTIGWLKYAGWVLGAVYLALYWGLATWLAGLLARRSGVHASWTFVPALLVFEELRGAGDLGFPWFQPGYALRDTSVLQLASLGGVTLVTAWLMVMNAALARGVRERGGRGPLVVLLLLLVPVAWGWLQVRARPVPSGPLVALVQGNIAGEIKWSGTHSAEILHTFVSLSDSAGRAARPRLVLWPETATGTYVRRVPLESVAVAELAARLGAPVYMGFAHYTWGPDGKPVVWNAAGGWNPDGTLSAFYAKRHLVPFGERVPFQRWFPALGKLELGQAEWRPGGGPVLFPGPRPLDPLAGAAPMSVLVCFESIFPDLARRDVRAGSRLLLNITNDEWFGNGAALDQHAAMAPFRAVENRVPVARCANTGITEMIDAWGVVTARLPVFVPAVLVAPLPAAGATTLFNRVGDWPGMLALLLVLVLGWSPWRRRPAL